VKKLYLLLAVALMGVFVTSAHAAVGFEIGQGFHVAGDSRLRETGRQFGFNIDVGDDFQMGYFFEEVLGEWRGDVAAATPNTVNYGASLNGLRAIKTLNRFAAVGLDIGNAQISQRSFSGTNATLGGANLFNQTKPFIDVLGRLKYEATSSKGITSALVLDLGYRFLDLNDISAAGLGGTNEATIDDMNAFLINLGVTLRF
jgi:hypothetical protein